MKLEQDLRHLADRVRGAMVDGDPYLLILGVGVARAANVPSLDELGKRVGRKLEPTDRRLIDRALYDVPAPAFYQDLANVTREGYLPRVVTTSYDGLLERTLEDAGLRAPYHYTTTDLGEGEGGAAAASSSSGDDGSAYRTTLDIPLRIVHCHGDLDHRRLEDALRRPDPSVPLRVVVAGFEFESPAVADWVAQATPGDLWWISPEPQPDAVDRLRWTGNFAAITGDSAQPSAFFAQLGLLLLGLPDAADGSGADEDEDEDVLEKKFVENQLARAKVYKHAIEQRVASVGSDPAASSQLHYQTKQIGELEHRLAKSSAEAFLARMRDFGSRLQAGVQDPAVAVDSETVTFFNSQLEIMEREAAKDDPNRAIMAAAQGALEGLVNELGPAIGVPQARA